MTRGIFWSLFYYFLFETADLRSYCGHFLAICQLCFEFRRNGGLAAIFASSKNKTFFIQTEAIKTSAC